jgi:hypothetical protein
MSRVGREFVRHILPQIIKPIRTLWNEMIGFVFLCLAAVPIPRAFRDYRQYAETGEGLFRVVLSALFITLMAVFGIHSFLRARKIARS